MTTLTIRILESRKKSLDDKALELGHTRMKGGKVAGNITALLTQVADALADKSPAEIRRFLAERGEVK